MNWMQISSGMAFLLLGVAVYALARSALIWGLPAALHFPGTVPWLARVGGSVPTFAHTAALALLTTGVLGGKRRDAWIACGAWTVINTAFEFGQHPQIRIGLVGVLPDWLERVWLLDRTRSYFMNGTFDFADIVGAVLGAVAAYLVIRKTRIRGEQE
jgi:hypothetical protein